MEILSTEFFSALLAIVIIDLVLAGDNAIVIALAARNLPDHLRTRAVVWGTVGAIVVRSAMTLIVVWLLKIPGLLLAGGLALLWIAYKLLVDTGNGEEHKVGSATSFWAAMKTIVIADAVMGLDNVLAVAGAAQGSFLLVVLGLLISIPIVIGGSQLILKYVHKYPSIVYIGAGVLIWTGVKMMTTEPLIKDYTAMLGNYIALIYVAAIGGVLGAGLWSTQRHARNRVAAHAVDLAATPVAPTDAAANNPMGASIMKKILIPMDGTASALQAVRHVINQFLSNPNIEVHLLHVRAPFSQYVSRFVSKSKRHGHHRELAENALKSARAMLDKHGLPHASHIELGDPATVIDRVAQRLHIDQIAMGTARKSTFTRFIQDSVTSKVLETTRVPVEVIAGGPASWWERIGVPATVGTVLVAFFVAAVD